VAWRFAWQPARSRLAFLKWMGVLVSLTSMLGFVVGCIKTFLFAGQLSGNDAIGVVVQGVGESANNLGLGLCMLVMATIGVVVGHAKKKPVELVDPAV
jgi:hypothetical protein